MAKRYDSFSEFYPFYLSEHANVQCRRMHYLGTTLAWLIILAAVLTRQWWWLLLALVAGYGCAWIGHFVFEKNRPATFQYPLYSFMGDWVMYKDMLTGKIRF